MFSELLRIAYGTYGLLFLAGVAILTFITVGRATEGAVKTVMEMDVPHFLLLLAAILVIFMVLLTGSIALLALMVGFALLVLLPTSFYLMIRNEIEKRTWKKKEEEAELAKFMAILRKGKEEAVGHIGLARVYERYNRYLEAAQEYHIVGEMFSGEESGYRERMEQKETLMRRMHTAEERTKTLNCQSCGAKNRPQQRRCAKCGSHLYRNAYLWVWSNTNIYSKLSVIGIIVVSLLYVIWLPFVLGIALMLIWLGIIFYLSLPLETVFAD